MVIALIPARSESKRVPNKNIKDFFGKPLMTWTIELAIESRIFDDVYVSSDSQEYLDIARKSGASPILRSSELASDTSSDVDWVNDFFESHPMSDYVILRPTNPFRTCDMLVRAMVLFSQHMEVQHLRAVELCKQHPWKMWNYLRGDKEQGHIHTLFAMNKEYLNPTQTLPEVYIQNGSLEIWRAQPFDEFVIPYVTEGYEGFDINTEEDWILAEALVKQGKIDGWDSNGRR